MSPMEIAWTVVGIAVPVAISLGYNFAGLTPPDFRRARFCFIGAAIGLGGMEIVWYTQTGFPFVWRVAVASLICLTIGIGLPETLRWIHKREGLVAKSNLDNSGSAKNHASPQPEPHAEEPPIPESTEEPKSTKTPTASALPKVLPLTRHIEHPTGFLEFDKPQVPAEYNVIGTGKQFGVNFRSRNPSPERVLRAYAFTAAYILPAKDESDRVAADMLEKQVKELRPKYISGEIQGPEVPAGSPGIWGTLLLHQTGGLTQEEAEGIIFKKLRIYYVSWLAWTDLQGRMDWSDHCSWLQVPDPGSPPPSELVWHFCQARLP